MKELCRASQAFGAACVFESHIATHPALRLHPEALVTAIQIYADLDQLGHAEDIVDFVEEYKIQAPDVYPQLLRVYIRKGKIDKAESHILRMKRANCELTPDLYYKLAQLFSSSGHQSALINLHEETQLWCPEAAFRIQAVLVRYFIKTKQLQRAQTMMQDMFATGVPFHHSIFSTLLSHRIAEGHTNAIRVTLDEMNALGVQPHDEFSLRVIRTLLVENQPKAASNFVRALAAGNFLRQPLYYHLIMQYYRHLHQNWEVLAVYNALRDDKLAKFTDFSFVLAVPALSWLFQTEPLESRQTLTQILLTVIDDMIKSRIDPDPMSVGYMMDLLLAADLPERGSLFALFASQQLRDGRWKRTPGAIQATAYGLYYFSGLSEQREFADYVIKSELIPTSFVLGIVTRHLKLDEATYGKHLPESHFDLRAVVDLMERHASLLETPAYLVDRFASSLQVRGFDELASRMFAAVMHSRTPVNINTVGSYRKTAAWLLESQEGGEGETDTLPVVAGTKDTMEQQLYFRQLNSDSDNHLHKETGDLKEEEADQDSDTLLPPQDALRPHL